MKRPFVILLTIVISLVVLFALQNLFLFGLPFIHAGSEMSDVDQYMGRAEYHGDIGLESNTIYFVRFYPMVFATVNVNVNSQGTYVSDGRTTSEILHNVNWIKWKWVLCLDRKYAVKLSLPHPDGEPNWNYAPLFSLFMGFPPILLILLILSKFRHSVNSV